MQISVLLRFRDKAPTIHQVLVILREHTGLADIQINKEGNSLNHPLFKERNFFLIFEKNEVSVNTFEQDSWYLFEAVIVVLMKLGGEVSFYEPPSRAFKEWDATNEFEDIINYENSLRIVFFTSSIPSKETIINKLKQHTGLYDIEYKDDGTSVQVIHTLMVPPNSLSFDILVFPQPQKSEIALYISPNNKIKSWYFVDSMLAVLVALGGEATDRIPSKAWLNWERASKFYSARIS